MLDDAAAEEGLKNTDPNELFDSPTAAPDSDRVETIHLQQAAFLLTTQDLSFVQHQKLKQTGHPKNHPK